MFVAAFLEAFGETLDAGDAVLSGAFVERAQRVRPGSSVHADFGPLGHVSVRIGAAGERAEA